MPSQPHFPTGIHRGARTRSSDWGCRRPGHSGVARRWGRRFRHSPAPPPSGSVSLVAYSTPKPAYAALIKAFNATRPGKAVTFSQSFGASGSQATSVVDGLPADVVNFSLAPDMQKLVKAGIVSSKWNTGPTKGMVTNSIVSFIVRKGNPKHITNWASLVKSGVKVITPNPFSSG